MHDQKQKWKFGSNFRGQSWAVTILPHLQESRPEIPRVEKSEREDENLPHLQEAFFYSKVNSRSECPQQLMS